MINFAFFLEVFKLYQPIFYDYDSEVGFKTKPNVKDWLKIIKSDKKLYQQIQIGFDNMKLASQKTDEGIKQDLELLIGKGNMYCQFCGEIVVKAEEEKHWKKHNKRKKTETELSSGIPIELENYLGNQMLLGRTEYEYELEFDRDRVYKFTKYFKI